MRKLAGTAISPCQVQRARDGHNGKVGPHRSTSSFSICGSMSATSSVRVLSEWCGPVHACFFSCCALFGLKSPHLQMHNPKRMKTWPIGMSLQMRPRSMNQQKVGADDCLPLHRAFRQRPRAGTLLKITKKAFHRLVPVHHRHSRHSFGTKQNTSQQLVSFFVAFLTSIEKLLATRQVAAGLQGRHELERTNHSHFAGHHTQIVGIGASVPNGKVSREWWQIIPAFTGGRSRLSARSCLAAAGRHWKLRRRFPEATLYWRW